MIPRHVRRLLATGAKTLLGVRREMLFIPYRYAGGIVPAGSRPAYPAAEKAFRRAGDSMREMLVGLGQFREVFEEFRNAAPPAPRWEQDWFPRLDAAAAYAFTRWLKPKRIVEVGSGHSTRFLARAVADGGLATKVIAIDPAPRADIADLAGVEIMEQPLQEAPGSLFDDLGSGDFLSIDSSHLLVPGSDVDILLNRVIPALPAGAVIHIHDIFLPDDYPVEWDWRGYSEQLGVLPLVASRDYEVLWSSRYAVTRLAREVKESVAGSLPLAEGAQESSLWLRKKSAP
jgi:predicted O-methyltransferase YrrM